MGTREARWVLLATVLGSGVAFLDGTIVNVALPAIADDLDAGLGDLQWVVNAYLVTLSSLVLLGGSLGDRFGRTRVFTTGLYGFRPEEHTSELQSLMRISYAVFCLTT